MHASRETVRGAAIIAGAVGFLFGGAIVAVTMAGPSSADTAESSVGAIAGPAMLAFDLGGLPRDVVLIVERRNGPKGRFVEVARSSASSGRIPVGPSSDARSVMRVTVVGSNGEVLMRVDREY
jgi:hypothetical protein